MESTLRVSDREDNYEIQVFHHMRNNYETLVERFRENLIVARKTILHQLIQGIIREEILPFDSREGTELTYITFRLSKEQIDINVRNTYTLGQIDIVGDVLHRDADGNETVLSNADQFLSILVHNEPKLISDNFEQFCEEISNSSLNYGLALTAAEKRMKTVQEEAEQLDARDSFSYVEKKRGDATFSPLTFFEQWVVQGHTIHPCSRTRLGLSPMDVSRYAPEWGGQPDVIPVLVHKSYCRSTHKKKSATRILLEEYPELQEDLERVASEKGIEHREYELIPVHPWQFEHTISKHYRRLIERNMIIPLSERIKTMALISFRSLAPFENRSKHHIKTAINVQMTSAVRTVSAASTYNGPLISSVLKEIGARDPFISNSLSFMGEDAGIHFEPDSDGDDRHFLQKNLASIIRENPEATLTKDEVAIPAAAFIADSPVSQKLILQELVERYKEKMNHPSLQVAAEAFIKRYCEVLLPGIMSLIVKYGVSLEAHLQNTVCVFKDGVPERVIFRDNGGIRILTERLETFVALGALDNSTNLLTTKPEELHDIFFHAIIHNHIGEMNVALSRRLDLDEQSLWNPVRKVVRDVYESLKSDTEHDYELLKATRSRMKALVKMRLTNKYTENMYVDVVNPLHNEVFEK
ncbi:IucA/IucC family protein [Alkalihalobacillus sp. CinArs1]|uniref:IucA/IucC family protein n=1 Tax=Alkalihalobacillus sp. CinArs1 TaxID=2995314 RepID=UPI0022DD5DF6|nr:IucA/IucC family protein [Alkalihalobacillus sp. CinArs1]